VHSIAKAYGLFLKKVQDENAKGSFKRGFEVGFPSIKRMGSSGDLQMRRKNKPSTGHGHNCHESGFIKVGWS
tara:strand:+ start:453 stop:668 length:216 start_codon:yes stop_codon:yes gene_type:complete